VLAPAVQAQEPVAPIEQQMTAEQFKAAGLDRLDAEQLATLNAWLNRAIDAQTSQAVATAKQQVKEESRGLMNFGGSEPIIGRIDGEFRGIVGVDLSLARIVGQADSIHLTPSGFAFVLDAEGEVLRGASYDLVSPALDDPSNEAFGSTIAGMRRGETGVDRVTLDGREYFIGYAPLRDVGASLAITAPIDEITAEAADVAASIEEEGNRTVALTLVLLAAFFVAALAGTAWLNRRLLLSPIDSLVAATAATHGNCREEGGRY